MRAQSRGVAATPQDPNCIFAADNELIDLLQTKLTWRPSCAKKYGVLSNIFRGMYIDFGFCVAHDGVEGLNCLYLLQFFELDNWHYGDLLKTPTGATTPRMLATKGRAGFYQGALRMFGDSPRVKATLAHALGVLRTFSRMKPDASGKFGDIDPERDEVDVVLAVASAARSMACFAAEQKIVTNSVMGRVVRKVVAHFKITDPSLLSNMRSPPVLMLLLKIITMTRMGQFGLYFGVRGPCLDVPAVVEALDVTNSALQRSHVATQAASLLFDALCQADVSGTYDGAVVDALLQRAVGENFEFAARHHTTAAESWCSLKRSAIARASAAARGSASDVTRVCNTWQCSTLYETRHRLMATYCEQHHQLVACCERLLDNEPHPATALHKIRNLIAFSNQQRSGPLYQHLAIFNYDRVDEAMRAGASVVDAWQSVCRGTPSYGADCTAPSGLKLPSLASPLRCIEHTDAIVGMRPHAAESEQLAETARMIRTETTSNVAFDMRFVPFRRIGDVCHVVRREAAAKHEQLSELIVRLRGGDKASSGDQAILVAKLKSLDDTLRDVAAGGISNLDFLRRIMTALCSEKSELKQGIGSRIIDSLGNALMRNKKRQKAVDRMRWQSEMTTDNPVLRVLIPLCAGLTSGVVGVAGYVEGAATLSVGILHASLQTLFTQKDATKYKAETLNNAIKTVLQIVVRDTSAITHHYAPVDTDTNKKCAYLTSVNTRNSDLFAIVAQALLSCLTISTRNAFGLSNVARGLVHETMLSACVSLRWNFGIDLKGMVSYDDEPRRRSQRRNSSRTWWGRKKKEAGGRCISRKKASGGRKIAAMRLPAKSAFEQQRLAGAKVRLATYMAQNMHPDYTEKVAEWILREERLCTFCAAEPQYTIFTSAKSSTSATSRASRSTRSSRADRSTRSSRASRATRSSPRSWL
jgi:hypothetical protein